MNFKYYKMENENVNQEEIEQELESNKIIVAKQDIKFLGKIRMYKGHSLFRIDHKTLNLVKVLPDDEEFKNKNKIVLKKEFSYIIALNKKNALKRLFEKKGSAFK